MITYMSNIYKTYTIILLKTAILLAAMIAIYWSDLALIFSKALVFTAGNINNYVLMIPFLIAFVIYRNIRLILVSASLNERYSMKVEEVLGLTLAGISIFMYVYGSSTLYAIEFHAFSMPIFISGLTLLLFNMKTLKNVLLALVLLAYIQPLPGEIIGDIAADLSWISASISQVTLSTFGMPIKLETSYGAPALVIQQEKGSTPFYVGEPSSGVYSAIGLSLFGLFVAYIIKGALWKRISIFILGFPIFFVFNAFRISIIIALWYGYGEAVSESFHAVSGVIMVTIGTFAILLLSEKIFKASFSIFRIKSQPCDVCEKCNSMNEKFCLLCGRLITTIANIDARSIGRIIVVIMVASAAIVSQSYISANAIVSEAQSHEERSNTARIAELDIPTIKGPETTEYLLPKLDGWDLQYAYRDTRVEKVLNQDAALAFIYRKNVTDATKPSIYAGIQISTGRHTWEASMVIQPSKVGRPAADVIELKDIYITEDQQARFFVYKRPGSNLTEAVLYWFERLPLKFGDSFENRNVQIILWSYVNVLARSGMIKDVNDIEGVEEVYKSMAAPIKKYWTTEQSVAQSARFNNVLVQQAPLFSIAMSIPAMIISAQYYSKGKKSKQMVGIIYNKLDERDRKLIDAIQNTKHSTGESILKAYNSSVTTPLSESELMDMLRTARDSGLIAEYVDNINGEPRLTWKVNIHAFLSRLRGF